MLSRAQRAFTLIEVLVVVVIVGIISSVVLLSAGLIENDREVREEARRIVSLIELAADEALLQGRDFGLEFAQSSYRFVEYDPYTETWVPVAGDDLLRMRQLPDDLRFELFIEGRRILLEAQLADIDPGEQQDDNDRGQRYAPQTQIMSSGQLSPFELTMTRERDRSQFAINVKPDNTIEFERTSESDF